MSAATREPASDRSFGSASLRDENWLELPTFYPDALGFAARTSIAILLAYFVSFWAQIETPASAGICAALIAQPTQGMALSKAFYRVVGTIIGGVVALFLASQFPQSGLPLLIAFCLWLGLCSFVASLLRDFGAYGAVLCGYTVGIILLTDIDTPQNVFDTAINRVAANLIGIAAVALVNLVFTRNVTYKRLASSLEARLVEVRLLARRILDRSEAPDPLTYTKLEYSIVSLHSEVIYAAAELADGKTRSAGARNAIAGLVRMLVASRAIDRGLRAIAIDADVDTILGQARRALDSTTGNLASYQAATPLEAFILERARDLICAHRLAADGLDVLVNGANQKITAPQFTFYRDYWAAALSAVRTMIAAGLCARFCVVSGWSGSSFMLIQLSAFAALLGMQINPTRSAIYASLAVLPAACIAGVVAFLALPIASSFELFALATMPAIFAICLVARHPHTALIGINMLLYFTLLLNPSNQQTYDFLTFTNNALMIGGSAVFLFFSFVVILPVAPKRRFNRVADDIALELRKTFRIGRLRDQAITEVLQCDRLGTALTWLAQADSIEPGDLERLIDFADLEIALERLSRGLAFSTTNGHSRDGAVREMHNWVTGDDSEAADTAMKAVLEQVSANKDSSAISHALQVVSGIFEARLIVSGQKSSLRLKDVLQD
ncbi:MAG: FUSC family protein [Methylovirgula sp.]|uniref:FUSC family protein n=1 Tax=Methylovirgula sp. TaxID=1978224 RepID=UPI0030760693